LLRFDGDTFTRDAREHHRIAFGELQQRIGHGANTRRIPNGLARLRRSIVHCILHAAIATPPSATGAQSHKLIRTLEDGDFVLTENSAILKYLADRTAA
jgi:hypothetical protein